jgi:hypothetical protein
MTEVLLRQFSYWPFLLDPPDDPWGRPESEYGPITDETTHDIVAESSDAAEATLPAPPEGCYWGLVGFGPVPK